MYAGRKLWQNKVGENFVIAVQIPYKISIFAVEIKITGYGNLCIQNSHNTQEYINKSLYSF